MAYIHNYEDFLVQMDRVGFSLLGDNSEGVFTLGHYFTEDIQWHTGDPGTDPWTWRLRLLKESRDFVYGKFLLRKSAWITGDWLPHFVAVRRQNMTADELYDNGLMTRMTKTIYDLLSEHGPMTPLNLQGLVGREHKAQVSKSLVELQMLLLISMVDETYKLSKNGTPYGWPIAVYGTLEGRLDQMALPPEEAYQALYEHLKTLNPQAKDKAIQRMIGRLK